MKNDDVWFLRKHIISKIGVSSLHTWVNIWGGWYYETHMNPTILKFSWNKDKLSTRLIFLDGKLYKSFNWNVFSFLSFFSIDKHYITISARTSSYETVTCDIFTAFWASKHGTKLCLNRYRHKHWIIRHHNTTISTLYNWTRTRPERLSYFKHVLIITFEQFYYWFIEV